MFGGQGLGATMAQGAAFGAGSAAAHMAVRSMMGGGGGHGGDHVEGGQQQPQYAQEGGQGHYEYGQPEPQVLQQQQNPCMSFNQNLLSCLQQNRGEITICQSYMDMLNQCERDQMNLGQNYQ